MSQKNSLKYSLVDKLLEVLALAAAVALVVLPWMYYGDLPESIPTHFGFSGLPDDYGSKGSIKVLPIIGLLLYVGLSLINFFVVKKDTRFNADKNPETISRGKILSLLQMIKALLNVFFAWNVFTIIQVSQGKVDGLGQWYMPTFVVLIIFLPIIFLLRDSKAPQAK